MSHLLAADRAGQHVPSGTAIPLSLHNALEPMLTTLTATAPALGVLPAGDRPVLIIGFLVTRVATKNAGRTVASRVFFEAHLCHGTPPFVVLELSSAASAAEDLTRDALNQELFDVRAPSTQFLSTPAAPYLCVGGSFTVVLGGMTPPLLQLQVREDVVSPVLVLVVDKVSLWDSHSGVLPPDNMMLVHVAPSVSLARIPFGSDNELVGSILHGSGPWIRTKIPLRNRQVHDQLC